MTPITEAPPVVSALQDGVLVLTINREDSRNALNTAVAVGIGRWIAEAESRPDIRAMVLTGAGDRAFSAGMDLAEFAAGGGGPHDDDRPAFERFRDFLGHGRCEVPVVAAANGSALAGGFELLMACDLIVAADHATFGLPEVRRGLFAAGGGTWLAARIPLARALELTLTGDAIAADEALDLGIVNRVVPADRVLDEAMALAARIAANGPLAVRATKELVRASVAPGADLVARRKELQQEVFSSDDAREGAAAFLEKRDPDWKGS